ncbi:hypothetical protein [Nostoc sp.]|uniref:hypothetical protein n=1 Tax=Nostoc sp. TaxID=1180 RepID=UPI002FFBE325
MILITANHFSNNLLERLRQRVACFSVGVQRWEPPFGFTSRLRRETRLQRWIHRNAVAPQCPMIND